MRYDVTIGERSSVVPFPGSIAGEVIQNVWTILNTRRGDCPLNRDLGLTWSFLDLPVTQSAGRIRSEVTNQVARFEPRAKIVSIRFEYGSSEPTTTKPIVTIEVDA